VLDEDILVAAVVAVGNGIVTATLFQIPNAPIVFANDPTVRATQGPRVLCGLCAVLCVVAVLM
jgi:hypothetical protein